ncbi:Transposase [compost metagenome]
MASYRKRGCKCPKDQKKCTCGATWSFRLSVKDPKTGERIQPEGNGYKTRQLAVEAAAQLHAEILSGTYIKEKDILFEELAERWYKRYSTPGKVKGSSTDVRNCDIKRLNQVLGKRRAKDITRLIYEDALLELHQHGNIKKKCGYSKNTLISTHTTAKMIFKYAIEMELIKRDPTQFVEIPVTKATVEDLENEIELPNYFEKEQLSKYLIFVHDNRPYQEYAQYHLLAYTGMRLGELHALKISDVDFKKKTISITKTLYSSRKVDGKYPLLSPKTKSSKRIITIDDFTISVIKNQIADLNEFKMAHKNF